MPADRRQPADSVGVARLLAAARNLPNGNAGPSDVVIALRFKNIAAFALARWTPGLEHRGHAARPVGLCPHHNVEFSAVCAAARREAPRWVVDIAFAVWFAALAALGAVLVRLRNSVRAFV